MTPELEYMTRVFGVRAVALGVGYLASSGEARRLWHRLWLLRQWRSTSRLLQPAVDSGSFGLAFAPLLPQ